MFCDKQCFVKANLAQIITPQKTKLGSDNNTTANIYIYIYICCRVKTLSKNGLFLSQNLVQVFSFFFFFCFSKIFFFLQGEILKKNAQKQRQKTPFLSQNLVQFCCATYLDQVLTQPWTKLWLNIFANFWVCLLVWKDAETTIFIVLSAKKWKF